MSASDSERALVDSRVELDSDADTCAGSGAWAHPIAGTNMNSWITNTLQGQCPRCGQRFMGWIQRSGIQIPTHKEVAR